MRAENPDKPHLIIIMRRYYLIMAISLLSLFTAPTILAEVYWEFQIGGMYSKANKYPEMEKSKSRYENVNWGTGINLFIPVSKRIPLLIETGLHYRWSNYQYFEYEKLKEKHYTKTNPETGAIDSYDFYKYAYILEDERQILHNIQIPLKLNYELRWNSKNSVRFGLGVYARYALNLDYESSVSGDKAKYLYLNNDITEDSYSKTYNNSSSVASITNNKLDPITVGINPSIVYSHRCVSFGVNFEYPLIYNGLKNNRFNPEVMITFGLKFKSKTWKYIGMGVGAAAMVAGGVSAAYLQTKQGGSVTDNIESDLTDSDVSAGPNTNKGKSFETMYYKWEKRAIEAYDSLVDKTQSANMFNAKKKLLRDAQKEMRKARSDAKKYGVSVPKSYYEDVQVSPR